MLADFLDTLPEEQFEFDAVVSEWDRTKDKPCGSVCCAIGWAPMVFPELIKWDQTEQSRDGLLYRDGRSRRIRIALRRGEQSGQFEACELLRKWGFTRIAKRMREHFSFDKKGSIGL